MSDDLKILFVFVDGFGLGADDPEINPLCNPCFPTLQQLLRKSTPIDACLSVTGTPQSATGQASLFCGVNAAETMGRHIEGFPPPRLKELVEKENLFSKLLDIGKRPTFANSYWIDDPYKIPPRRQSVTTVMTLAALGEVRHKEELLRGEAVNHDITRWSMHLRGYDGPLVSPEDAASHLLTIAEQNDFTLFEYFLTDRAGHSGNPELISECLETLERFLSKVMEFGNRKNRLFLLSSDHGNIEDNSTFMHTTNPVPLVALGQSAEQFHTLKNLTDVTPAILRLYDN